jgi:hypothetical protein
VVPRVLEEVEHCVESEVALGAVPTDLRVNGSLKCHAFILTVSEYHVYHVLQPT